MCIGIEARLRAGRFRVCIPAGGQSVLRNVCTLCTAHLASYSVDTKVTAEQGGRDVKLITHLRVVPRLRISGTIYLSHLTALMTWTEKDLPLPITTGALRYKPESRGFGSRWCHLKFN
jgi:hypothetical protein